MAKKLKLAPGASKAISEVASKAADRIIALRETRAPVTPEEDDLSLPKFLQLPKPTPEQRAKLIEYIAPRQREWIMPDNSPEAVAKRKAAELERRKAQIFVANEDAPVTVTQKTDDGPKTIAVYQNMKEFRDQHNFTDYPFSKSMSDKDSTVILVRGAIWLGKERKTPAVPRTPGKSKAEVIGEMLLRPEGVTSKEVCEAMGWPSVSMPAQAKVVGLTLRKEKVDGITRYWGIKS